MNKRILVVSAGLLALVVFALGVFFYTQQQAQQAAQLAQANRTALVRPHSPAFGNPGAKASRSPNRTRWAGPWARRG